MLRLRNGRLSMVITDIANGYSRIVTPLVMNLESVDSRAGGVFFVAHSWWYTIELQPRTSGAWPRVRRGRVTLDLSSPASFTCAHHCRGLGWIYDQVC
jgi:hypothetical protein